jgi:L-fuconolactonase
MNVRIDAHQHFWQISRGAYPWLTPELRQLHRDFMPEDLRAVMRDARIDKTILVHAAQSVAETDFMLELAARTPFVAGVVGWIDFDAPDATTQIARLARNPRLVGLRPMLQDMPDERWILRPEFAPIVHAMQTYHLRFDASIRPRHLRAIAEFAMRYPGLAIVIDHAAKPAIGDGHLREWRSDMQRVAESRNVHCKLSGLATETGAETSEDLLRPYVDTLLEAFGPRRLMWGSNWPMLPLAGDYLRWLETAQSLTADLTETDRAGIFGETAAAFYRISQ